MNGYYRAKVHSTRYTLYPVLHYFTSVTGTLAFLRVRVGWIWDIFVSRDLLGAGSNIREMHWSLAEARPTADLVKSCAEILHVGKYKMEILGGIRR